MNIALSPIDYYFFRRHLYTIQFACEYDGHPDLSHFKKAMREVTKTLPVLSSRLKRVSNRDLHLETNGFEIPLSEEDLSSFDSSQETQIRKLFDPIENVVDQPLVTTKVTRTKHRTYIGFSCSHMLMDGFSFLTFVTNLSRLTKGQTPHGPFAHDRNALFTSGDYQSKTVSDERLLRDTGYFIDQPETTEYQRTQMFLTHQEVQTLKIEAASVNADITANDAIMAYLLHKFYKCIPLSPKGELIVRCPVDYRRLYPKVPVGYFGNAICDVVARFDPGVFTSLNIGQIASEVRYIIASIDAAYVSKHLACLYDLRHQEGSDVFEKVACPGLIVSNLSRLPFANFDFGFGTPLQLLSATHGARLALILPTETGIEIKFNQPTSSNVNY